MADLTALVLTYNEEKNIAGCLSSLDWVKNIIIIDSFSTDQTKEICLSYNNVQFYQHEFNNFAEQRNFGLKKLKTDWVLVVDADERVTEALQLEITKTLKSPAAPAYKIPRKNYFLGKWIKYCGWYPDYSIRLFKSSYHYQGLVHESPIIKEPILALQNDFIHYTYSDLASYLAKINQYTTLDAAKKFARNKKIGPLYLLLRPILEFIKKFILKKGFLLGSQGLILSVLSAYYQFLKAAKLWELNNLKDEK